jgi:hypothetical protein
MGRCLHCGEAPAHERLREAADATAKSNARAASAAWPLTSLYKLNLACPESFAHVQSSRKSVD